MCGHMTKRKLLIISELTLLFCKVFWGIAIVVKLSYLCTIRNGYYYLFNKGAVGVRHAANAERGHHKYYE